MWCFEPWMVAVMLWLVFSYGYGLAWFAFDSQLRTPPDMVGLFVFSPIWVPFWLMSRLFTR